MKLQANLRVPRHGHANNGEKNSTCSVLCRLVIIRSWLLDLGIMGRQRDLLLINAVK